MAEIFIYDDIGPEWAGMVSAKGIVDQIKAVSPVDPITIRINSPGGDVNEGTAIYNAIAAHQGEITAKIDGIAASAASFIAMAADKIEIAENAKIMIHNAWTFAIGNKADLQKTIGVLDKYDGTIAATYAARSGLSLQDIQAAMDAETWYTAQEAVDAGLADSIGQKLKVKAAIAPGRFKNAPKEMIDEEVPKLMAQKRESARLKLRLTSK